MGKRLIRFLVAWELVCVVLSLKAAAVAYLIVWAIPSATVTATNIAIATWAAAWGVGNVILGLATTEKPWKYSHSNIHRVPPQHAGHPKPGWF